MSDATDPNDVLAFGNSDNTRHFWEIEPERTILRFEPRDAAPALIGDEDQTAMG